MVDLEALSVVRVVQHEVDSAAKRLGDVPRLLELLDSLRYISAQVCVIFDGGLNRFQTGKQGIEVFPVC